MTTPGARDLLRRALAAIGMLAVLTLLVQPVCSAYELSRPPPGAPALSSVAEHDHGAKQGRHEGKPCCSDIEMNAVLASPSADLLTALPAAKALTAVPYAEPTQAAPASYRLAAWNSPPPLPLPYHVRSARILR